MIDKDVDLRSDTVTSPTAEMREAMARAMVGDDVYGEDPTVKQLEQEGAACVGKEEALFLPSGTMGNLVAVLSHTGRGDAVLLDSESHIFYYEAGGASVLGGVQFWPLEGLHEGGGAVEMIKKGVRPPDQHFAPVRLLCLENTHNRLGGRGDAAWHHGRDLQCRSPFGTGCSPGRCPYFQCGGCPAASCHRLYPSL